MNDFGKESALDDDDAVEALLGKATPRPAPPHAETEAVRDAVRDEWRKVTGRRRRTRRTMQLAIAASVLVAAFLSLNLLRTGGIEAVQVASIEKQFGSVSIIGEQSQLPRQSDLSAVVAGQSIRTGLDAGVALDWFSGGSLRLDADTRIDVISGTEVYLESGRLYFDSAPALAAISGTGARLTIRTDFGDVTHVGTQYMVQTDRSELTVSVRTGAVEVTPDGRAPARATRNQRIAVSRSGTHHIVNIKPFGGGWQWLEQAAPGVELDGRTVEDFLDWVAHETGMTLHYESEAAEAYARQEILNGQLRTGPREALTAWMLGTDLEWRMDEGVIYVSKAR